MSAQEQRDPETGGRVVVPKAAGFSQATIIDGHVYATSSHFSSKFDKNHWFLSSRGSSNTLYYGLECESDDYMYTYTYTRSATYEVKSSNLSDFYGENVGSAHEFAGLGRGEEVVAPAGTYPDNGWGFDDYWYEIQP